MIFDNFGFKSSIYTFFFFNLSFNKIVILQIFRYFLIFHVIVVLLQSLACRCLIEAFGLLLFYCEFGLSLAC